MSTNNSVPGLLLPTVQAPLAGSPGASAMAARNNQAQQQAALANAVGGRRKMRRGGAITVPQMPGDTSGANAVIAQNAQHSTQAAANAQFDAAAMKKGGSRRKKGGNPNWSWGCSSGGRSKRRTMKRRTMKRRTTKTRRNKK
jgi:hypothetical protein